MPAAMKPPETPSSFGSPIARALLPFQQFARSESAGAVVLLCAAVIALVWANSPWRASYFALWNTPIVLGPASHPLTLSLQLWINDALMALFFLVVGLELK